MPLHRKLWRLTPEMQNCLAERADEGDDVVNVLAIKKFKSSGICSHD